MQLSVLLAVVTAFTAVTLMSRFSTQSAMALGKVSAMVSATAVVADAWSKVQAISRRLDSSPTAVDLPAIPSSESSKEVAVPRRQSELDEFFDEHPSMTPRFRTGGLRGYSAYDPPRG